MDWTAIRERARGNMTAAGWMYNEGAADIGGQTDYDTLAWRRYGIVARAWHDVTRVDTSTTPGDVPISTPIVGSPTAYRRLASPHGEVTAELGAQAAGSFIVYPTNASVAVEEFAAQVHGPWWAQVYLFRDRDVSARYLERVVKAGTKALVLTTDCPGFVRDFGFRNGIDHTDEGGSGNFPTMTMGDWTLNLATDLTPGDVVWLREHFGLPVWVKGILRPEDAIAAVGVGASGIMASNHGRRQVDGVVPVAWALPRVAVAVGHRVPILADSGIRSGWDVFRALALGGQCGRTWPRHPVGDGVRRTRSRSRRRETRDRDTHRRAGPPDERGRSLPDRRHRLDVPGARAGTGGDRRAGATVLSRSTLLSVSSGHGNLLHVGRGLFLGVSVRRHE